MSVRTHLFSRFRRRGKVGKPSRILSLTSATAVVVAAAISGAFVPFSGAAWAEYDVWARALGGTGNDWATAVTADGDGNVYTVGYFDGTADFDPDPVTTHTLTSAGGSDVFVSKLDSSGHYVWAIAIGGAGGEYARAAAVDSSGNVYIAGEFTGTVDFDPGAGSTELTAAGGSDAFVSKIDPSGTLLWARAMGGIQSESVHGIAVDGAGNVYTVGRFTYLADFNPSATGEFVLASRSNSGDGFVSKLDTNGEFAWARGIGSSTSDQANGVAVDTTGNVYVAGAFEGTDFKIYSDTATSAVLLYSRGSSDAFVVKFTSAADLQWVAGAGGSGADTAAGVAVASGGNVYTTGYFNATADFGSGATLTAAGTHADGFVWKIAAAGGTAWARGFASDLGATAHQVAVDSTENVFAVGTFDGTVDFDPSAATYSITTAGSSDGFVAKLDANGDFMWAGALGGTSYDEAWEVAVRGAAVYTVGYFNETADFNPGAGTDLLTASAWQDAFVSKLSEGSPPVPAVASVSSSKANGTYGVGTSIPVAVTFSEPVTVTGAPQLLLETGTTDRYATYSSGSGSAVLTFDYTVAAGDVSGDLDYAGTDALSLNGGTIQNAASTNATLTLPAPGATGSLGASGAIVVDGVAPTVLSVGSTLANGTYGVGTEIPLDVTFSEAVTVTGTPRLLLETGATDRYATYTTGSSSAVVGFGYTVQAGDASADLDYTGTGALGLNGGSITDAAGNSAVLTLPAPGATGSLGANADFVIDTTVPNRAPVAGSVTIAPSSATVGTYRFVAAPAGFTDPDGDPLTFHYAWTLNGNAIGANTTSIRLAVKSSDVVAVTVFASDGTLSSDDVTASLTVANSVPKAGVVKLSPTRPYAGAVTFTAAPSRFSDPDGDSFTYHYAWTVDGTAVGSDAPTMSTTVTAGQVVAVSVTATDSHGGESAAATAQTVVRAARTR